jgi:hypothetical protein
MKTGTERELPMELWRLLWRLCWEKGRWEKEIDSRSVSLIRFMGIQAFGAADFILPFTISVTLGNVRISGYGEWLWLVLPRIVSFGGM